MGLVTIALDDIVALETRVWQALVDGDAAADGALLSDDFVGVYPTGYSGRAEHVAQLVGGSTVLTFVLSDFRLVVVSPSAALLAYRARYVRAGSTEAESMYVSSLWCERDGRWVNVFSQDTPDNGAAVV